MKAKCNPYRVAMFYSMGGYFVGTSNQSKWQSFRERAYRRAASLAASRTSGFSALFFWMTSNEAPTIDLEYGFLVVRRLFLTASAWISFLCCFLYMAVQVSFAGFRRLWK
ncbi:Os05g0486833 [Oryza sativa Japonica Group]|uniref:Os05g0486833 protein n=1 Tax=Oryza sativa subsp. japonica TaxID=39947 RepID=A0A0P0WP08_ORYSJ|nr:hypothetical protein EE612_030282 [Oryza sativa]BAS94623.1 Os05g0486833 [Oryza sativa Japonica Group]